jgi:hypothetical protein
LHPARLSLAFCSLRSRSLPRQRQIGLSSELLMIFYQYSCTLQAY